VPKVNTSTQFVKANPSLSTEHILPITTLHSKRIHDPTRAGPHIRVWKGEEYINTIDRIIFILCRCHLRLILHHLHIHSSVSFIITTHNASSHTHTHSPFYLDPAACLVQYIDIHFRDPEIFSFLFRQLELGPPCKGVQPILLRNRRNSVPRPMRMEKWVPRSELGVT
jgi:hypothetical protein